ncbi:MAG: NlpC/P60 family protein [Candidatus Eremiobacteraeota bacterium]|nr:NlpC/P60 family protein [Candidatus Eremiobacteraeota bacterium]
MTFNPIYGGFGISFGMDMGPIHSRMANREMMLQANAFMPVQCPTPPQMLGLTGFYNNCLGSIEQLRYGFPMPPSFGFLSQAGMDPMMMNMLQMQQQNQYSMMMFMMMYQQMQMQQMLLMMLLMQQGSQFGPDTIGSLLGGNGQGSGCWTGGAGDTGGIKNLPWNSQTGNRLADYAAQWDGKNFKPGQTKRCADFVSTMIEQSGVAPKGFNHQVSCEQLQKYGQHVNKDELKPGDVVYFKNTYTTGNYTHVGIYIGNGKFVHRPTANAPCKVDNLNSSYYQQHYSGARRLQ